MPGRRHVARPGSGGDSSPQGFVAGGATPAGGRNDLPSHALGRRSSPTHRPAASAFRCASCSSLTPQDPSSTAMGMAKAAGRAGQVLLCEGYPVRVAPSRRPTPRAYTCFGAHKTAPQYHDGLKVETVVFDPSQAGARGMGGHEMDRRDTAESDHSINTDIRLGRGGRSGRRCPLDEGIARYRLHQHLGWQSVGDHRSPRGGRRASVARHPS